MVSKEELASWETQLQEEVAGLRICQERVKTDQDIPVAIKTRFRKILNSLNSSIAQVISRTRELLSESVSEPLFSRRAAHLRSEYSNILHNIDKLLKTVDTPQFPESQEESPEELFDLSQLTVEMANLEEMIETTGKKVGDHKHLDVENELQEVRTENDKLCLRLKAMQEEQTDLETLVKRLNERLVQLETARFEVPLPKFPKQEEPRLLAKRVGEAEKILRR